jgi:hypothetical protein
METRAEYERRKEAYQRTRPRVRFRLPSGLLVEAIRPDMQELVDIFARFGLDMANKDQFMANVYWKTNAILDDSAAAFVKEPQFAPSTASPDSLSDNLSIRDLTGADRRALLDALVGYASDPNRKGLPVEDPGKKGEL